MYSDAFIIQNADGSTMRAQRLPLGETAGHDEAWLRDQLFDHPQTLPISELDSSYGPLIPLCRELGTEAGPVDIAYINQHGLLTLVECKLWRNPEARRKVVAQVIDYARAIARWTYADLQRQVAIATRQTGNVPFELVRAVHADIQEHQFVDAAARGIRAGRFQLVVAGDGIREDISGMTEIINRNAALGFSFGMVEVALYEFGDSLAIHPRVLTKTLNLERTVVLVQNGAGENQVVADISQPEPPGRSTGTMSAAAAERARWWAPVEPLDFDDPEQPAAKFTWPNNLYTPLPGRGLWLSAYRSQKNGGECGVYLGGRTPVVRSVTPRLVDDGVLTELPEGTQEGKDAYGLIIRRPEAAFESTAKEQHWLSETMRIFVNILRPRLKRLLQEESS